MRVPGQRIPAGTDEKHWTLHVETKNFRNSGYEKKRIWKNVGSKMNYVHYETTSEVSAKRISVGSLKFDEFNEVALYPNGHNELTEGFVCIVLCARSRFNEDELRHVTHVELTCVVSVIDAEGTRRVPRSFVISQDTDEPPDFIFFLDKYISRNVLLSESSELLPKDTLTLHVDIVAKIRHTEYYQRHSKCDSIEWGSGCKLRFRMPNCLPYDILFRKSSGVDSRQYYIAGLKTGASDSTKYLALDSPFCARLAEESFYFERVLDTPMIEKNSKRLRIPREEWDVFPSIETILCGPDLLKITEIGYILDVYVTADKYLIESVIDTCRCWLRLCICTDNASSIADLADFYDDRHLKEIVEDFRRTQDDKVQSHRIVTSGVWTYENFGSEFWQIRYHLNEGEKEDRDERNRLDFYS